MTNLVKAIVALAAGATVLAVLTGCGASTGGDPAPVTSTPSSPVAVAPPVTTPPTTPTPSVVVKPKPKPKPNPCARNHVDQLVVVKLAVQRMWLCHQAKIVRTTAITSGMAGEDTRTPTGKYHIQGRNRDSVLTLNTGAQYDVKYWIPFDAPLFGFHDSSWQHFPYGSPKYKTDGSHGCIHMPLKAIAFFYDWVQIGADVTISRA